jgi:hypothetical protein
MCTRKKYKKKAEKEHPLNQTGYHTNWVSLSCCFSALLWLLFCPGSLGLMIGFRVRERNKRVKLPLTGLSRSTMHILPVKRVWKHRKYPAFKLSPDQGCPAYRTSTVNEWILDFKVCWSQSRLITLTFYSQTKSEKTCSFMLHSWL